MKTFWKWFKIFVLGYLIFCGVLLNVYVGLLWLAQPIGVWMLRHWAK